MSQKNSIVILSALMIFCHLLVSGQSRQERKELEKQMANFPLPLKEPYPKGSLGEILQELYKHQARSSCGIIRQDERLYIPKDLVEGYRDKKLRDTQIYSLDISAQGLLFLTLKLSDVEKLNKNMFKEDEFVTSRRILGINDELVSYGKTILKPIDNLASLYYQKSCGSYFNSKLDAAIKAPVVELETSLKAETERSSSITTITGNFFSPLSLILRQSTDQSIFAHLLLWEIYREDYERSKDKKDLLYESGHYISEFKGTLTNTSSSLAQSLELNGRLSAGISVGVFSGSGSINTGIDNKVSFSLKDFNTTIHKLDNGKLQYELSKLPSVVDINNKLQGSQSAAGSQTYVTHLTPTVITRTLSGVPEFLCNPNSWAIQADGYEAGIWKEQPTVISSFIPTKNNEMPRCICTVSGYITKAVVDENKARNTNLSVKLRLENILKIGTHSLSFLINEPSLKVTDSPKVLPINSEIVNATRKTQTSMSESNVSYTYKIPLTIDQTGVKLKDPIVVSHVLIDYINKNQETFSLYQVGSATVTGNMIELSVATKEKTFKDVEVKDDSNVPIKLRFTVELSDGTYTEIVTEPINLRIPNLIPKIDLQSKI